MIALIKALVVAAALAHGINPAVMQHIASCESGYDANVINPAGPYYGLVQLGFHGEMEYFITRQVEQGLQPNWRDPSQQANYLAEQLRAGHGRAWGCFPASMPLLL